MCSAQNLGAEEMSPQGGSEQVRAGSMNFEDPWCSPSKYPLSHLAVRGKCLVFHLHSFLFILNLLPFFFKKLHLIFWNKDLLIQSLLWRPCSGAGSWKVGANAWIPSWEAWPATKKTTVGHKIITKWSKDRLFLNQIGIFFHILYLFRLQGWKEVCKVLIIPGYDFTRSVQCPHYSRTWLYMQKILKNVQTNYKNS